MKDRNELSVISLFSNEPVNNYEIINTSHGEDDFRETIIVTFDTGTKLVFKIACNEFTNEKRIAMWQRCAREYLKEGYYCPQIFTSIDGEFPTIEYKGHKCVVYAEEFAEYKSAEDNLAAMSYRNELYLMTAKIAKRCFDYTALPSGYTLFKLFPGDTVDEVTENALSFRDYCHNLPMCFREQATRIFKRWEDNYAELKKIYFSLPFSVFQADFNYTNVLVDNGGKFVGIYDFNLAGRDEFLNYLFREIHFGSFDEELTEIMRALRIASQEYCFSQYEIEAAQLIYRCIKPLWYTRVEQLKNAGSDLSAIQKCLDDMEHAQNREIDFESVMRH